MVKKDYVIIQEINKELEKHRNFIGYIDGRLNAFDGDLLVIKTRYEKTKKEYNENTKGLQNARTDTLNKIKILESKLKNVGRKPIPKPKPLPIKKKIIEKVKEIIPNIEITEEIEQHQIQTITEVKKAVDGEYKQIITEGKIQCPECKKYFTKGGAFASHYKSHFPDS